MLLEILGVEVQYIPKSQMSTLKSEHIAGSLPALCLHSLYISNTVGLLLIVEEKG